MEKRIYTCATAHLDTIWNWSFEHSVGTCLYNTLVDNFKLFENYPDYKFNFEGTNRYELFEEYYPEYFDKLKKYIKEGRWNVTGSAFENGDVNVPSPEALFRNILYGNEYFHKKFGKRSKDIFLPDCFGFGYALPAIIRHSNLLGFTTQKLTWGSAYGTPFDIGKWYGVNGKYCFACVNPDSYSEPYSEDIRSKKDNVKKLKENEEKYELPWTFSFHGTGDQGGAPKECSAKNLQKAIDENSKNDVKVLSAASDDIYYDLESLSEESKSKLPKWDNELVMRDHGAGGYTSRAIGKRLSRKGEELCDVTERFAVLGTALGGMDYPQSQMEKAWKRIIAHQFHDDLPGTSFEKDYKRSWNDYFLSLNQLEKECTHSMGVVAKAMDTSWVKGEAVAVFNSLEFERTDLVKFNLPSLKNKFYIAKDKEGNSYPVDVIADNGKTITAAIVCKIPSLGAKVFDIRVCENQPAFIPKVKASRKALENNNFIVTFNSNGEISQIHDKQLHKDLLKEPIVHQLIDYYGSIPWPAWELTHKSVFAKKYNKPVLKSIRIVYSGISSAAIEVISTYGSSVFKSVVSLYEDAKAVKVQNEVEWWEQRTLYKDSFKFNISNPIATYDLGLGAIERKNNTDKLFEVPAQKWVNISNNGMGVGVISDCKYGWDKPSDDNIRMTVLHTPARNYTISSMQSFMDLGLNLYGFEICSHNDISVLQKEARMFNQPLTAVSTDIHKGKLKDSYSFAEISNRGIILRAVKKAENTDEIIVRFNEGSNKKASDVHFSIGEGIESAREVFASEETIGEAKVQEGELVFDIAPYDVKTFALTLKPLKKDVEKPEYKALKLELNTEAFTSKKEGSKPVITDYKKLYIPKEICPKAIKYYGMSFKLDKEKALYCDGQTLNLGGKYNKLYFLAFSKTKDHCVKFVVDGAEKEILIHSFEEPIGKWDLVNLGETAQIKNCDLAYEFTHAHNENGEDVIAKQMYLFSYEIDVKGAENLTLPVDSNIIIFSANGEITEKSEKLLYPLYDRVRERDFSNKLSKLNKFRSAYSKLPFNAAPNPPLRKRSDGYVLK